MESVLPAELVAAARCVVDLNRAAGRRITVAESCTGGLVAAALTEIPGSSDVLDSAIVSYSNEAKLSLLNVSSDVLDTFGAVSIATAWSMAQGVLEATGADVAVAITGIDHMPKASRQLPRCGNTNGSIVATGTISPMIRPLV